MLKYKIKQINQALRCCDIWDFVNGNHLILMTAATKLALMVLGTILNVGIPVRIVLADEL